jgi:LEA14-like dessication related protein
MRSATRETKALLAASLLAASLLALGLFASCASPPPVPPTAPKAAEPAAEPPARADPPPRLELVAGPVAFKDQYRLSLPLSIRVDWQGGAPARMGRAECILFIEGAEAGRKTFRTEAQLEGASPEAMSLEFEVDLRSLAVSIGGKPSAAWRVEALVPIAAKEGAGLELLACAEGSFPIIREPSIEIKSIKIERDLLVTTNLRIGLEIYNPNDFPLELGSISYDFFGEGKLWADGAVEDALSVPPLGRAERGLRFTMNFADMDRRLLDLVAKLNVVRYRLVGEARIATGLDYLPSFISSFDREGSCLVER